MSEEELEAAKEGEGASAEEVAVDAKSEETKTETSSPTDSAPSTSASPQPQNIECSYFRAEILSRLQARNSLSKQFESVFSSFANLSEELVRARTRGIQRKDSTGSPSARSFVSEAQLEALRLELSEVYKNKSVIDQELLDSKQRLSDTSNSLHTVTQERDSLLELKSRLCAKNAELEVALQQIREDRDMHRDERAALQAHVTLLTAKVQKLESERAQLIERIKELQEKQAAFYNTELEQHSQKQQQTIMREIAEAVKEVEGVDDDLVPLGVDSLDLFGDVLPQDSVAKFEANEGEVTAIAWIDENSFAVGGSDKMVRVYRGRGGRHFDKVISLVGCNQTVTRLDWNSSSRCLLASSNDHTARLWNIDTGRLLATLSGHTDKVSSARFIQDSTVVTGSYDRSIRLFDVRVPKVIRSFFPGSTVLDVAVIDTSYFISGHMDKKLRVWDGRSAEPARLIEVSGRITSIALSADRSSMVCSLRDDTLVLFDLRNYAPQHLYSAESYRSPSDTARCTISPGGEYVAAGSADGPVFVWQAGSTKMEKKLARGGHSAPVQAVAWSPSGHGLLSSDRLKTVCVWL